MKKIHILQNRKCLIPVFTTLVFFVGLSFVGCFEKPLSPVAPEWDVTVNVPLINRIYTVDQILEKDATLLRNDPSGLLIYSKSQEFSAISVGGELKVDPTSENYQFHLGAFSVKSPSSQIRSVSIGEMNPSLGAQQGNRIPVQPFNFSLSGQAFPPISEFQQASIVSGDVTVTFINRLELPLDNISLRVQSQLGEIAQFSHPNTILPNDSAKQTFSLANQTVGNTISFSFSGRYPGSEGTVHIDTSSSTFVRLDFSPDIQVSQAVAKLPSNTFTTSGSFDLDDSTKVESGKIRTGSVAMVLNNPLPLAGEASLVISNVLRPNGSPFTEVLTFPAQQQNVQAQFSLDGYSIQSPDGKLNYAVTTKTSDSGNNFVTLDSSISISGSVSTSEISFERVQGRIKPTSVDVNVTRPMDLGDINRKFSGTTRFTQANMYLMVTTPGQFPFDLNATLIARNKTTGQTATLSLPSDQRRVSYPQTTITLSETNSNVVSFLNSFSDRLPDEFSLSGSALFNPTYAIGSISASDSVVIQLSVEIPLKVGIMNGLARDTTQVSISADTRKDIDRTNYGKVYFEVQNGLPSAVHISIELLDSQQRELLALPKASQPNLSVSGAQVDAQGKAILPASSTSYIELASDDVKRIQLTQFVGFSMAIETTGGGTVPVQFRTTDFIHLRAYSTLNYRANFK